MSQWIVTVQEIESVDTLHIVTFLCHNETLKMMSLELNDSVQIGKRVLLTCKPTSVSLAKLPLSANASSEMLSDSNQLKVKIASMEIGDLLSSIQLQFGDVMLESIITSSAVKKMHLNTNDVLLALIKANELSILEVLDD